MTEDLDPVLARLDDLESVMRSIQPQIPLHRRLLLPLLTGAVMVGPWFGLMLAAGVAPALAARSAFGGVLVVTGALAVMSTLILAAEVVMVWGYIERALDEMRRIRKGENPTWWVIVCHFLVMLLL